jgi:hypothetical protein
MKRYSIIAIVALLISMSFFIFIQKVTGVRLTIEWGFICC